MAVSRRDFLKGSFAGLLGGAVVMKSAPAALENFSFPSRSQLTKLTKVGSKGYPWKMVIDINKCIGCGKCVRACRLENDVPLEPDMNRTWVERYTISDDDEVYVDSPNAGIDGFTADYMNEKYQNIDVAKSFFVPKTCNHCENPPCVSVCPVAATYATKEGVVLVNRHACIGCRYCIQACPYGARFFDRDLRIVDKCTWCYHRITKGLLPACVEVCPVHARNFGDVTDPNSTVSRLLKDEMVGVLKGELGTEPQVFYIGLEKGVR